MLRRVAQPGSALAWGARGREFESRHADQNAKLLTETSGAFCFVRSFFFALSILRAMAPCREEQVQVQVQVQVQLRQAGPSRMARRSEERRVGKECRSRW